MQVRPATNGELPDVCNVLDGGLLRIEVDVLVEAIEREDVLVAVENPNSDGAILGTLVLDGDEIVAVAVRQRRRGQGIGTALVEAAHESRDSLIATFDERVRPFWESLGCSIEERTAGRRVATGPLRQRT